MNRTHRFVWLIIGFVLASASTLGSVGVPSASAASPVTLSPSSGPPGTAVQAYVTTDVPNFVLDVYWDGTWLTEGVTDGSGNAMIPFTVPQGAAPGAHEVRLRDGGFSIFTTFTVTSPALNIDLTVDDAFVLDTSFNSPSRICVGDAYELAGIFHNIGTAHSGAFNIEWRLSDGRSVIGSHASLPPGGSNRHTAYFPMTNPGQYTVTITPDYDNRISESNESNNARSTTFTVEDCSSPTQPPTVDCSSATLNFDHTSNQTPGIQDTINVTGTGWVPGGTVTVSVTPTLSGTLEPTVVDPNGNWTYSFWLTASAGTYTYTFQEQTPQCTITRQQPFTVTTPDTAKPGGTWISPANDFTVTNDVVHFEVEVHDYEGGPGIDHVNFTALYSGSWHTVATLPFAYGGGDTLDYDWDVSDVPAGPLTLSFDVYDNADESLEPRNVSPNGERSGQIQRQEPQPPGSPSQADYGFLDSLQLPWRCGDHEPRRLNQDWIGHDAVGFALDFSAPYQSDVLAPMAGTLRKYQDFSSAGPGKGLGYYVIIDAGNGWQVLLAHLDHPSSLSDGHVDVGAVVGSAGGSGGWPVHIHVEVRLNNARPDFSQVSRIFGHSRDDFKWDNSNPYRPLLFGSGNGCNVTGAPSVSVSTLPVDAAFENTSADCVYFIETEHNLCGGFRAYWNKFGALFVYGYPVTEEFQENGAIVQYFERARFEWRPGSWPERYDVELGLLGNDVAAGRFTQQSFQPAQHNSASGCIYFEETQHNLCGGFRAFFDQYGGMAVYGMPISEEFQEFNPDTGKTYTVQYFERQRVEWHPGEWPERFDTMLGRLGAQMLGLTPGAHD